LNERAFFVQTKGEKDRKNAAKFANFSIQVREFFDASSRKLRVKFAQTLHKKSAKGEKSLNERAFLYEQKAKKHANERAIFF